MLSKRMARHAKRAQEVLAALGQRHKVSTEQLLITYTDVLTVLKDHIVDEREEPTGQGSPADALAVRHIREVVKGVGGFEAQLGVSGRCRRIGAGTGRTWWSVSSARTGRRCSSSPGLSLRAHIPGPRRAGCPEACRRPPAPDP
jgi:hypothetical protein